MRIRKIFGISGISTSQDTININNHDFKSGEKVKYTVGTSAIGGLDGTEYYVSELTMTTLD